MQFFVNQFMAQLGFSLLTIVTFCSIFILMFYRAEKIRQCSLVLSFIQLFIIVYFAFFNEVLNFMTNIINILSGKSTMFLEGFPFLEDRYFGIQELFVEFLGFTYNYTLVDNFMITGLERPFIFLVVLLSPICILASWTSIKYRVRTFHVLLHTITLLLLIVFAARNLLVFYIAFEAVLIPMFAIIGIWGSRERKIHATLMFVLYTLAGSAPMLLGLVYLYQEKGSLNLEHLVLETYTLQESIVLFFVLFLAFAVKVPIIPLHIWLPEAHAEAPTAGSVILAGSLLKMGVFGLIKFGVGIFPVGFVYFQPFLACVGIVGIVYATFTTIRQTDLKKIIAYSSVAHMGYVLLGISSGTVAGFEGAFVTMIGHGFVSSGLFICVGLLYERYGTRALPYYGGMIQGMPLFSFFFFAFTLANVSLPGTSNFVGEFLVLVGVSETYRGPFVIAALTVIPAAVYSFWLYNRVACGKLRPQLHEFTDLTDREFNTLLALLFCTLCVGLLPDLILTDIHEPLLDIVEGIELERIELERTE